MKKVLALGMVAVALAIAAAGAAAGTNPNTLTLAVFGDSPYLDPTFHAAARRVQRDAGVHQHDQRRPEHAGGRARRRHPFRQRAVHGRLRPVDLQRLEGVPEAADLHARRQRVERLHEGEGGAGQRLRQRRTHPEHAAAAPATPCGRSSSRTRAGRWASIRCR